MNGASSTVMRPRSTGVTSWYVPSSARRNTEAKSLTSAIRPIGEPWYHHVPSREIWMPKSPQSVCLLEDMLGPADLPVSLIAPCRFIAKGSDLVTANSEVLSPVSGDATPPLAEVEALGARLALVRERIGRVIFGQREVVDQALITLLAGGHALLIGVPGLAKTRLVETLGTTLGMDDKRIQCTPDLMPADIIGSEVLEESETGRRSFRFLPGPVFCQLLMADEINRASPRTQSALLQAIQEGRDSLARQSHPLPQPLSRLGAP